MTSALERFKAQKAAGGGAPAGNAGAARGRKKNRWAGVHSSEDRDPLPWTGDYVFRVKAVTVLTEQGETYRASLEAVEYSPPPNGTAEGSPGTTQTEVGDVVSFLQKLDGESWRAGGPQVKRFTKAVVGIETDEEFDALDPNGTLIDAGSGDLNDDYPENPLLGRFVAAEIRRGKDCGADSKYAGDFWRNWKWIPLPDEAQEELSKAHPA